MMKSGLILLLLIGIFSVQDSEAYRLNVPRVLLPYNSKNQVSYILEVKEPDDGCFYWKSTRPNIVSVEALNTNGGCSNKAIITARSYHATEQSSIILATDTSGEISLSCDVRVDVIDRIEIFTTTGYLFIEGTPARITVNGFNSRGNEFSTLGSIPFEWTIRNADPLSDRRPLRLISFSESDYEVPFGISELENQKKRGASILIEGIQTGKASLTAKIVDPDLTHVKPCSTELFVVQKAVLVPSEDLFVPIGAIINFDSVILKQTGNQTVKLPSPQFKTVVDDESICYWNEEKSQVVARRIGTTRVTLIDKTFEETSKEMFEYVQITVVHPDSVEFTVDRGNNWHFQTGLDYKIHVKLRDSEGTDLLIPSNAHFVTNFDSDQIIVLESSKNGTYFNVRAQKSGITQIKSTFVELIGEDSKSIPFGISGQQKIEVNPSINVTPNVIVFSHNPKTQYEYKLRATGGSGHYTWTSENKETAVVFEDGRIRTGSLGKSIVRAEDYRNPLHFGFTEVLVVQPAKVGSGPTKVDGGSALTLYSAYTSGVPDTLADFFDRNVGLFIWLLTISITITSFFGLIWLCNCHKRSQGPLVYNPNSSSLNRSNSLKYPGRDTSSFINWLDTDKPKFYTSTPGDRDISH